MNRILWVVAGLFIALALIAAGLQSNVGTGSLSDTKSVDHRLRRRRDNRS
jgi:hypothetical protein